MHVFLLIISIFTSIISLMMKCRVFGILADPKKNHSYGLLDTLTVTLK